MTKTALSTDKIAFGVLYTIALNLLDRHGYVALGVLFTSILTGDGYEDIPREVTDLIADLDPVQIQGVYELVLARLEMERGPLLCDDPDAEDGDVVWGYGAPVGALAQKFTDGSEKARHRISSLNEGHPDGFHEGGPRNFSAGTLPLTAWRRLATELAA